MRTRLLPATAIAVSAVATAIMVAVVPPVGASVLAPTTHRTKPSETIKFASGDGWRVSDGTGPIGVAQPVCLNEASPVPCPPDAIRYGYPGPGWPADLTSIPDARWVWAPGVTGGTPRAEGASFSFTTSIVVRGRPTSGELLLAVDDAAELLVNGSSLGVVGSVSDGGLAGAAQATLTRFDLAPHLKPGRNVITVVATNGPASFSGLCGATCTYAQNPAGVVFGGSITVERGGRAA